MRKIVEKIKRFPKLDWYSSKAVTPEKTCFSSEKSTIKKGPLFRSPTILQTCLITAYGEDSMQKRTTKLIVMLVFAVIVAV